jgi:hypothetical protein
MALAQRGFVARRHQSSVDDPSTRDGSQARATPKAAQELEPSLGNSNLLRSTKEEVSRSHVAPGN